MTRISSLLSLAFSLALGSLFFSVYSLAPLTPLCPKTVYELQTLPFAKITEILNHKEKFAVKTPKIKAMFTLCKGYVKLLDSFYKYEKPITDVLGIAKKKYTLTTKAIRAVEASISGKVDKKTSLELRESCDGFTKGFLHIQNPIIEISAKHNYKDDANITFRETNEIVGAVLNFRYSVGNFMDLVNDFEEKKMKKVAHHAKKVKKVAHHARALEEDEGRKSKYFQFFGSFLEGKQHGRELTEEKNGGKINNLYEEFIKYMPFLGGNDHGRKLLNEKAGVNAGAQGSGEFKGLLEDFVNFNGGEKVQMDAAGKMKVAGKDGFRSLRNRAHYKLFVSKEA